MEEVNRLADPVFPEQPRILDVPEELEPFPTRRLLDGLQFGPASICTGGAAALARSHRAALPGGQRGASLLAGAGGLLIVLLAAAALFAAVAYKLLPKPILQAPADRGGAVRPALGRVRVPVAACMRGAPPACTLPSCASAPSRAKLPHWRTAASGLSACISPPRRWGWACCGRWWMLTLSAGTIASATLI